MTSKGLKNTFKLAVLFRGTTSIREGPYLSRPDSVTNEMFDIDQYVGPYVMCKSDGTV